jgi:hypothetical protein
VYEQILGIPWYAVFSRYTDEFRMFQLAKLPDGRQRYCEIVLPDGKMWIPDLKIGLGLWYGSYYGVERKWLRWYDRDGNWILTPAESEKQRADKEKERADNLAAKLKALGISPDDI